MSFKLEDIEEKARRDDLTGVYNRRTLIVAMEEAKQRADAAGEPLSICVIDLDLFKRYNDEFDHLTGDQVLRAFAQAAQDGLRTTDVFGRYGGEEFVQILRTHRARRAPRPMPSGCASASAYSTFPSRARSVG